jgi:hypothetical protein
MSFPDVYRARPPDCGTFWSTAEGVSRMTADTNTLSNNADQRSPRFTTVRELHKHDPSEHW